MFNGESFITTITTGRKGGRLQAKTEANAIAEFVS
jgi:hypothetical protein